MGNENYLNYYVEILTSTMHDAVVRNISLQANAKISENIINDQVKKNEDLIQQINNLNNEIKNIKELNNQVNDEKLTVLEKTIKGHVDRIQDLEHQLNVLVGIKTEYENTRHQLQHLETFRNELTKAREELNNNRNDYEKIIADLNNSHKLQVKELTDKIDYLQLTPTKKRKLEEVKKEVIETSTIDVFSNLQDTLKDGGSF